MRVWRVGAFLGGLAGCGGPGDGASADEAVDSEVGVVGPFDLRVQVTPRVPHPGDAVRCAFDGGPATLTWVAGGSVVGTGASVVAGAAGQRLACTATPDDGTPPVSAWVTVASARPPGNVLLVIGDDVGVDKVGAYGVGTHLPKTPVLDGLAAEGVRFDRAWAYPSCSPTRSTIQTGRYGYETGLGKATGQDDGWPLAQAEVTLPERIAADGSVAYGSAMVGKWHLGAEGPDEAQDPVDQGYGSYHGVPNNLGYGRPALDGGVEDYTNYLYEDGSGAVRRTTYLTTVEVDDAIAAITSLPEPWLVVLSFHAPHLPAHVPPAELYPAPHVNVLSSTPEQVDASLEALDTELGRVLATLSPDDTVVFVGDNGTDPKAETGPYPRSETKRTINEGGVRVPVIVRSPWVGAPGSRSRALVHTLDLFATIAEVCGVPMTPDGLASGTDSHSLLPYLVDPSHPSWRDVLYTERFVDNGFGPYTEHERAVRDDRYKLVWQLGKGHALYDLGDAWMEGADLLAAGPLDADAAAAEARLLDVLASDRFQRVAP